MARRCFHIDRPGGCRYGTSCRFSHDPMPSGETPPPSFGPYGASASSSRPQPSRGNFHSPGSQRPQGGKCWDYWKTGSCQWGMQCTRDHIDNPARSGGPGPSTVFGRQPIQDGPSTPRQIDPAAAIAPSTDLLFVTARLPTPADAQQQLRKMGAEGVRIDSPQQIYPFVAAMLGANASNETWTENDRNLYRQELAKTSPINLLLRLGEIVSFKATVDPPGYDRATMSFEKGFMPLIAYLTFDTVLKSPVKKEVNALYSVLLNNFEDVTTTLTSCLDEYIARGKVETSPSAVFIGARGHLHIHSLYQVLKPLASLLDECLGRWRDAVVQAPQLPDLVAKLDATFRYWSTAISATPATFVDSLASNPAMLNFVVKRLGEDIKKVVARSSRLKIVLHDGAEAGQSVFVQPPQVHQGVLGHLGMTFQGPGGRHDNDFASIGEIAIAPTAEELTAGSDKVYLPANLPDAPHHLTDVHPIERHLDVQFRLLREEAIAALRKSVHLILEDLASSNFVRTDLARILKEHGGVYRREGSFFGVFTGASFVDFGVGFNGFELSLTLDVPSYAARRRDWWESKAGLSSGTLVALIWNVDGVLTPVSGVVASHAKDIAASQGNGSTVRVKFTFYDKDLVARVPQLLQRGGESPGDMLLIKSDTQFPTLQSYLRALQQADPFRFPFRDLLAPGSKKDVPIDPPAWARVPDWTWDLRPLLAEAHEGTRFTASDPESVEGARELLKVESRLDPSQADAMIDILTREVALLQGPPGTGKSYTGVELIRVLLANKRHPILLMAYTNHALDHLLRAVIDSNITKSVVRLGSRSTDEVVNSYGLEALEISDNSSSFGSASRTVRQARGELKDLERKMVALSQRMRSPFFDPSGLRDFLMQHHLQHLYSLERPPQWIEDLAGIMIGGQDWTRVGASDYSELPAMRLWLDGDDIATIGSLRCPQPPPPSASVLATLATGSSRLNSYSVLAVDPEGLEADGNDEDDLSSQPSDDGVPASAWPWESWADVEEEASDSGSMSSDSALVSPDAAPAHAPTEAPVNNPQIALASESAFVEHYGPLPSISTEVRPLQVLETSDLWTMSLEERRVLHRSWLAAAQLEQSQALAQDFLKRVEEHSRLQSNFDELKAQNRQRLLRSADIIGCTTSGAAKLSDLIQGVSPKVILVEEAGQTLEPHILANLTSSVEQLILIGDPQQLRPTLNEYSLSIDNPRAGSLLYRFDVSLLERLAEEGLPMSQLQVQRRMQPEISSLIRPLYPHLKDHELVLSHPPVKGLAQNVYFLDHQHAEGGSSNDVSKHNTYEIRMIVDLVVYLLRQGVYGHDRGIVVLCAYLGQLSKLRQALSGRVTVVVDQRDQDALDLAGEEAEVVAARELSVSQQVTLVTLDRYQGDEGDVVVLSTVRNDGSPVDSVSKGTVGFLKSVNRANVALSRARHGLYILGSASLLAAHSPFWREVIDLLQARNQVGPALPIQCASHPDEVNWISEPSQLPLVSPDGGCLRACDAALSCGHLCPSSCHSDDPAHKSIKCKQRCQRVLPCGHPCNDLCYIPCRPCQFVIKDVQLPCGHVAPSLPCNAAQELDQVLCSEIVEKELPCGHSARVGCHVDPASVRCLKPCGRPLDCGCLETCQRACWKCQPAGAPGTSVVKHAPHVCSRPLAFCPHTCTDPCSANHECSPCRAEKVSTCEHGKPKIRPVCSSLAEPCKVECAWTCVHQGRCSLPCGSPCDRLPCDKPCDKELQCRCPCSSLCGESCPNICLAHSPAYILDQKADLLCGQSVRDLLSAEGTASTESLLIALPCKHVFTVETLDGLTGLENYYERDASGAWASAVAPPTGFAKLPVCPNCRATFFFRRYGRPIRKATLDILEQNLIHQASSRLGSVSQSLEREDEAETIANVARLPPKVFLPSKLADGKKFKQNVARLFSKASKANRPAPLMSLFDTQTAKGFLGERAVQSFRETAAPLLAAFKQALVISDEKSAHLTAWEAAFASRYQQLDQQGLEPEAALTEAARAVGLPPPRAQSRFSVEAILLSINIRYTLANLGLAFAERMAPRSEGRHRWTKVVKLILTSALTDAELVCRIATENKMLRYQLLSTVVVLRAKLAVFRFDAAAELRYSRATLESRDALAARSEEARQQAFIEFGTASFPSDLVVGLDGMDGAQWLEENCQLPAEKIMEDWTALSRQIRSDDFFEVVTPAEKLAIVRALRLGAGHWYQCSRGHAFAIGDCGGAMQTSRCPECGDTIGGANHVLAAGNATSSAMQEVL